MNWSDTETEFDGTTVTECNSNDKKQVKLDAPNISPF